MNANSQPIVRALDETWTDAAAAPLTTRHAYSVEVSHRIEDVEAIWRQFTTSGVESPGQSYDFIRLWVANRGIAGADQHYVVGSVDGQPVAILPLHRKRVHGVRVFTWFPGPHTGCYTPVADMHRLAALGPAGRSALWQAMTGALKGADLAYLRSIPATVDGHQGLFDDLGSSLEVETLYRSVFTSWTQCDSEQRSRSRRKHDRQQGDRLAALGDVGFEVVADLDQAHAAVDIMFAQRSARFRAQGIPDTFVDDDLIGFYQSALDPSSGLDVRVHALRLDGEIVAVRYNIVHGTRMFCLISSMSDCERIQSGSPGKQCLLRVMQSVFDEGMEVFDMGAGYTDEKRHWCNVQVPLRQHYVGLSPLGAFIASVHRTYQQARARAKGNDTIKGLRRTLQQFKDRLPGAKSSDQL